MTKVDVSATVGMSATVGEMSATVGECPRQWGGGMSATVGEISETAEEMSATVVKLIML